MKGPLLNNIAMSLIKLGKLERADFILDLMLVGPKPIDPTNFKAWKRKIDALITRGLMAQAQTAIHQAERYTETLQEKTMITSLYRDIAKSNSQSAANSSKILSDPLHSFASKPPDFTKLAETMLEYENEHLSTLSNT